MLPALLGLIAPVAAIKAVSQLLRAARSLAPAATLSGPPLAEKPAEVSPPKAESPVILAYDGMSRRTKITEFINGAVTSKKLYFWLGGSIVCERDGLVTGFPILKQYFGQGEVRGTTKLYYAMDHLGSIRELVDSAGTVQAEYRYSTYGERTKTSGNLESDWGYAGLWHHQASGLDLATYRAYDAANKRWISRDPLGEGFDRTLYSYCGNNPMNLVDPTGLQPPFFLLSEPVVPEGIAPDPFAPEAIEGLEGARQTGRGLDNGIQERSGVKGFVESNAAGRSTIEGAAEQFDGLQRAGKAGAKGNQAEITEFGRNGRKGNQLRKVLQDHLNDYNNHQFTTCPAPRKKKGWIQRVRDWWNDLPTYNRDLVG